MIGGNIDAPTQERLFFQVFRSYGYYLVGQKKPVIFESPLGDLGIRGRAATLELNSKDCRAVCGAMFSV